jgi:hypothetical protein
MVAACTPLEAIPSVFELGKYKPVVKFPEKFNDGLDADPVCRVMLLLLLVTVEIPTTLVPSQITPTVVPVGIVRVDPPDTLVLNVRV